MSELDVTVAIPRNLFADILRLIAKLRPPPIAVRKTLVQPTLNK
jgi:hypothetical protein